jgi:hypothetical protein
MKQTSIVQIIVVIDNGTTITMSREGVTVVDRIGVAAGTLDQFEASLKRELESRAAKSL